MNTVLGLIAVGLLAFLGAALFKVARLNPVTRAFVASGITFFFIGVLLGPRAIGLLDSHIVAELDLVVDLGIGWVGLLFGLQFRYQDFKKLYLSNYLGAMTQAIITLVVIGAGIWLVGRTGSIEMGCFAIVLLAAIGSTTSTSTGTASVQHENPRGPLTETIRLFESLDAVPAVLVVGLILCCSATIANQNSCIPNGLICVFVAVMLGAVMGVIFSLLTLYRYNPNQLVVIVLGFCVFSSGAAHYLRLSPLFVNFIVGLVVANTSRNRRLIFRSLVRLEKPLYLVLLIIAGSMWVLPSVALLIIVPIFFGLRVVGKLLGGAIASRIAGISTGGSFGVGPGMLAHDGMALALAISIKQILPDDIGDVALTVTVSSILASNLVGPWALRRMLIEQREIT